MGGEIESCLKLDERLSSVGFESSESSESSDEGVACSGVFEILMGVEELEAANDSR
jgi:hypothetical protein